MSESFLCSGKARVAAALSLVVLGACAADTGPARYRRPAPLEDDGPQIEEPVFGSCAGLERTDASLRVMEWVAKRAWHVLGLPYERKDFTGPPAMKVKVVDGWVEVAGTVSDGGVPCRNQVIAAEVEQDDAPILLTLRCADAFGELLIELDLKKGAARARSVTVNRSMIGGQSHSSPMPEQSFSRIVGSSAFATPPAGPAALKIKTLGEKVELWVNGTPILSFVDPDPAGGKFGFGSTGRMRVRNIRQWELISPDEKLRREACVREMHDFCKHLDTFYEDDVRARNRVEASAGGVAWTWLPTGATARLRADGPRIRAEVRSGLYGDDILVDGVFPEILVKGKDGEEYRADPNAAAAVAGDGLTLRLTLPLKSASGKTSVARAVATLTVQTVWFWTVTVEGVEPKEIQASIGLAPAFRMDDSALAKSPDARMGLALQAGKSVLRHNGKAGFYAKAIEPERTVMGARAGGGLGLSTTDPRLRFATVVLPTQRLNLVGFKHRMVHFIRYPEGPVEHWRRRPSVQEYPTRVDLARFAGNGAKAMVWHHTWLNSDFRDREGFFVNPDEMKRAMAETHRLGMKTIGYLGIVPGRSPLLRFEDTSPIGGAAGYGGYDKNWDLQDQTFYHALGRYPEFIVWMADDWCREYGLDGFYLDGGSFGQPARGATGRPLYPEDEGLSVDEIQHRTYYRMRKVLEIDKAGYGLEPWSGLDWMINGFYDCMMIGESFQEASPDYYRDGHNALLTGCMVKMYGMRETSQNPYNIAMAAVNLSDIQVCSGNGAWGDVLDTTETWDRVRPLWSLLDSIDWDRLIDARPWYAQELVSGEGFMAGTYVTPGRAVILLANKTEEPGAFAVTVDPKKLPKTAGAWRMRYCLGRAGDIGPLGDGRLTVELPALHGGPIGIEVVAGR